MFENRGCVFYLFYFQRHPPKRKQCFPFELNWEEGGSRFTQQLRSRFRFPERIVCQIEIDPPDSVRRHARKWACDCRLRK
ncbi:hypothetical protein CEXT_38361 [Caerostris extrusa]|uniref:Uncharacterized protein n=1 Tax=Caerostris extrusa TaxID=172846 RepID=A0AAV4NR27_CAEEX|nr:hypothetical protein CEXT_38361 [Caerostris extrusa]